MSRRLLRAAVPAGLAAAALLTVSACGDAVPFQSQEHPVVAGVEATLGTVLIRNATITIDPDHTSGQLLLVMFNDGSASDALTSVSSPQVSTVTLPSPLRGPVSTSGVELASQSTVSLFGGTQAISLSGITGSPRVGDSLTVTFQFAAAGSTTLQVPISQGLYNEPQGAETFARGQQSAGLDDYPTAAPTPSSAATSTP
ncbi:MAG TPA: copper chaperone PCu(A)C [Mycobacteriales bacterium]